MSKAGPTIRYAPVRWREDVGWEYRCDACTERGEGMRFWPLTEEYWNHRRGMARCRACWLAFDRQKAREYRATHREARLAYERERYRANRRVYLIKRREYYERRKDYIRAKARERYYARKAAAQAA